MAPLSAAAKSRNLLYRVLSGLVLGPVTLALAFIGDWPFGLALSAASAVGFGEWLKMTSGRAPWWGYAAPFVVFALYRLIGADAALIALAVLAALFGAAAPRNRVLVALGLPYVALTLIALSWLRDTWNGGWPLVFFVFVVVWATDIGAFFVGRTVKGPRLAPGISPNKTWSGFAGGLALAALAAIGLMAGALGASRPVQVVEIALGLSLLGQGGDLFESAIKRRFGVKDSGDLIPGHGGMLDRIDALLWVAPAFALLHALGFTSGMTP
ncbi:MAG TPA: phosphatidate cytidylyltransferase [Alphaproteobacteria bacterium]|jgi:phosphatidate cytidylyltransferase|nr:phosphatidate cytidylyltransferase [Alphaproteobacteria bacterium]